MRIALRPSGGRGDYELAGSFDTVHASDLLEKRFFFQLTPALTIDGRATAHRLSGKPRIRPSVRCNCWSALDAAARERIAPHTCHITTIGHPAGYISMVCRDAPILYFVATERSSSCTGAFGANMVASILIFQNPMKIIGSRNSRQIALATTAT